jgi:hypothetical protein
VRGDYDFDDEHDLDLDEYYFDEHFDYDSHDLDFDEHNHDLDFDDDRLPTRYRRGRQRRMREVRRQFWLRW